MNRKYLILSILFLFGVSFSSTTLAFCPVCVVAVGAGLELSRWLGVDDAISSLWIGALLISLSVWTINWLKSKNWNFKFYKPVIFLAYYLLTLLPMYYYGIIGGAYHTVFGIDKILFGTILGTAVFAISNYLYLFLKKKNNDKPYFPYQKVVMPVGFLILTNILIYFIIK